MSGLVTRSLTQYKYDPSSGQMILVPDLATDLGTHNDNYTQWKFTIRPGVKWENGDPVTAKEVAWGMTRCMDAATFPTGACQYYSNVYYKGGASYKGPYTAPKQNAARASRSTATPSPSTWPSPSRTCPTGAHSRPTARSRWAGLRPQDLQEPPAVDRSLQISKYSPSKELVLVRNPHWDPKTDPARTQYPDGYDFKTQQQSEKIDQILLADSGSGQTTLTYDNLLAPDYQKMKQTASDRLTLAVRRARTTGRRTTGRSPT